MKRHYNTKPGVMELSGDDDRSILFRECILRWFRKSRRDLPWRRTTDPYAIWISEIMLQQTQVKVVLKYYEPFLARFPSVFDLARASLSEVLASWSGLGYYGRAVALHRAAKILATQHDGELPRSYADLRRLPGIGAYTAGAIMSLAFRKPVPAVDANAKRVLRRAFRLTNDRAIDAAGALLVPRKGPGEFNQALMELGAVVCMPRVPKCDLCPLERICLTQGEEPKRAPAKIPARVEWLFGLFLRDGRVLFRDRPVAGLLGGLTDLPWVEAGEGTLEEPSGHLLGYLIDELGRSVRIVREIHRTPHAISGRKITARLFLCRLAGRNLSAGWRWVQLEAALALPLSSLTRRLLVRLLRYGAGDTICIGRRLNGSI